MRSSRLTTALVVAAFASVLTAGSALAGMPSEPPKGSVGEYVIRDSSLDTSATCHYNDNATPKIDRIAVGAPIVYWPDQDSNDDNERGRIKFSIVVQKSTDGGTTWSRVRGSTVSTGTAYEHTKASLAKRVVSFSVSGPQTLLRVMSKVRWINTDGTFEGSLRYWHSYARLTGQQLQGTIEPTPCSNKLLI